MEWPKTVSYQILMPVIIVPAIFLPVFLEHNGGKYDKFQLVQIRP